MNHAVLTALPGTRCHVRIILMAMALAWAGVASGQIPKLAEVPAELPKAKFESLTKDRNGLGQQKEALQSRAAKFNARCAEVVAGTALAKECEEEQRQLERIREQYVKAATAFNQSVTLARSRLTEVRDLERQLERDQEALRRMQKTIELTLKELEEWSAANQEAEKAALLLGIKALGGTMATKLEKLSKSASAYQGWVTRYAKQLQSRNVNVQVVGEKLSLALRGYVGAAAAAKTGTAISTGLKAEEIWKLFKDGMGTVLAMKSKSDATVKELLADPQLKAVFTEDKAGWELAQSLLTLASESEEAEKLLGPQFALASFIVDYGYEATKWTLSRNRILQRADPEKDATVIEAELKSIDALKRQIESTTAQLKAARLRAEQ